MSFFFWRGKQQSHMLFFLKKKNFFSRNFFSASSKFCISIFRMSIQKNFRDRDDDDGKKIDMQSFELAEKKIRKNFIIME